MPHLEQYFYFLAQAATIVVTILVILVGTLAIIAKAKEKGQEQHGKLVIQDLNENYTQLKDSILEHTLDKFDLKKRLKLDKQKQKKEKKQQKIAAKDRAKHQSDDNNASKQSSDSQPHFKQDATSGQTPKKTVFVLQFNGDIRASAVNSLTKEVSAIVLCAKEQDEVLLKLESGGGMVNCYGLAASQLERIRQAGLSLTIAVDKVAASGGYMMACVADKILAAPFAIVGSIGVIAQIPNLHRWLDKHNVDFEQITAGKYKRTLTMFGKNDEQGRKKMTAEIEETHLLFQDYIKQYRQQVDLEQVATGEHWYGSQALQLKLVDQLITSEAWLLKQHPEAKLLAVSYKTKRSLAQRVSKKVTSLWQQTQSAINQTHSIND